MNIPQPLISTYRDLEPLLDSVERRVADTLSSYAQTHLIPFLSRKKTIESVAEKIETGRYHSFSEIDDLIAVTLVVAGLHHEDHAIAYCRSVFDIFDVKQRTDPRKPPDSFRFDATRLYGRLRKPSGLDAGIGLSVFDIIFEIQIRTAFEHAWIVATHPLTYKTDNIDWRRFRLAAQIKANVENLDLTILNFDSLATAIIESPWPDIQQRGLIARLVERLVREGVIPTEAAPKDMSRFAENFLRLVRASKKRVDIEHALDQTEEGLRAFSQDDFPRSASILQICMAIMFTRGVISAPFQKYTCHVTHDLVSIFPGVDGLSPIFEYGQTPARA